ncbi:MAG: hypothetical protein SH848_15475 [Saprospiraceae bacterium]|nr:hypothetical protein [Saprospiraceae bacterium]MDZ4705325.1 hypothetical protein [Saprospiraceae bacterium]
MRNLVFIVKHLGFWAILLGTTLMVPAQTDSVWLQKWAIPAPDVQFFFTDHLLQSYLLTPSQELIKYGPDGVEQFRYNNRRLGMLARVDASNPFNLLLYYPDYQTALTLDRTLNKTGEWSLLSFGFLSVPVVATSADNQLWLYDAADQRLKKIGADGVVLVQSDNLMQVLGYSLQPSCLLDRGNLIYLSDPARGIIVFDAIGQYHVTIALPEIAEFQMLHEDGVIYYQKEGALWQHDPRISQSGVLPLPRSFGSEARFQVQRGHLFVLSDGVLQLFSLR